MELSTESGLRTMSGDTGFAVAEGLMTYGPNFAGQMQRAACYGASILKGAKPAGRPVEQPMTFDFVVNLKTAQALGVGIPLHVLLPAADSR